jgi:hypothetical protein
MKPMIGIDDMTCCSWHSPRNAIVNVRTGAPIPREVIDRIPPGREKDDMLHSGNMCDPCARKFSGGTWSPMAEPPIADSSR